MNIALFIQRLNDSCALAFDGEGGSSCSNLDVAILNIRARQELHCRSHQSPTPSFDAKVRTNENGVSAEEL